jgi:hypothetical protein
VEGGEPWKLEKVNVKEVVRERINKFENLLKDDKSVSPKTKQELLEKLRKLAGIEKIS